MEKRKLILACLAASENRAFEPIQIQKLIFVFQEKASKLFTRKPFTFKPYDYGPFSSDVYSALDALSSEGLVDIFGGSFEKHRVYKLKSEGEEEALAALKSIPDFYQTYLCRLTSWVKSLSFAQLVGAIYREFPKMRERSIFREP